MKNNRQFKRLGISGKDFDVELTVKHPDVVKLAENFKDDELKYMLNSIIQGFSNILFIQKDAKDLKAKKRNRVAYLCGPIEFAAGFGANWRKWITNEFNRLNIDVFDPCEIEAQDTGLKEAQELLHKAKVNHDFETINLIMNQIQDRDYDAIDESDFTIILLDHSSGPGGTYCEVEYAKSIGKPIYAVCLNDLEKENSWIINSILRTDGKIFFSFEDLLKFLKKKK